MATVNLFDMLGGSPQDFGIMPNPEIEELLNKQKEDQRRALLTKREQDNRLDLGKQVEVADEPGNNVFNQALLGMLRRGVDEKGETFDAFLDRKNPALVMLTDAVRGGFANLTGKKYVTKREELMDQWKVEESAKLKRQELQERNQQAALKLAWDMEEQKRAAKIQAVRDQSLAELKVGMEELKSTKRKEENVQKSDLKMGEYEAQGKIRENALRLRYDLTENLEQFKADNKEKAGEVAFERAKELVRLRSSLGTAAKANAQRDVVDGLVDVAAAGLVSQDKIMSELDASTTSKVLKELKDNNIIIMENRSQQENYEAISTATSTISLIYGLMKDPELGLFVDEGPNARIRGTIEQIKAAVGSNPKLNALEAKINALGPTMARIRGDRGNIAVVEQKVAKDGFFSKPTATRAEGEALFTAGGTELLNTALAALKSRVPQQPSNEPENTITTKEIFLKSLEQNRDPVAALRAALQRGMNVLPVDYSSLLPKD